MKALCQELKSLVMSILGYGQWKGRQNLNLLIDDYQQKVTIFTKKVESK
ncbi:PTS sugar transporter [Lactobacillus johnsonii]|uniref:PTS sugar transporter n=1 Tax=Lactobacillus johnsonii TaxID=33959 RepID=A0A267M350_LACJH|nr:PTS sugar transporter [Lactobacillus johnsonii]